MCKIGIASGKVFDPSTLDPTIFNAMKEGIEAAEEKNVAEAHKLGERENGCQMISGARWSGVFWSIANSLQEAYYPETSFDSDNESLDNSKHNYVLHFDKTELPPVKAFWSLSMCNMPEQLFIENEIDRYVYSKRESGRR